MAPAGTPGTSVMAALSHIPPVTRWILILSVGHTALTKFRVLPYFNLDYSLVFTKLQLHRLFMHFFFHRADISFLIEMAILYRNSSELENKRSSPVYLFSIVYYMVVILALIPYLGLYYGWGEGLVMAVNYMWAQEFPNLQMNFWGLIRIKALYMPWFLIALRAFMSGSFQPEVIVSILVAHTFVFLERILPRYTGKNYFSIPSVFYTVFGLPPPSRGGDPNRGIFGGHSWGGGHRLGSS